MRKKIAVVAALATIGVAPALSGVASADTVLGDSVTAYSRDTAPGAKGRFVHDGDKVKACNRQDDTYNALTRVEVKIGGVWYKIPSVKDKSWNGKCKTEPNAWIDEGRKVRIKACLIKDGNRKFCTANWKVGVA